MSPENILWYALRNARPDGSEAVRHVMSALERLVPHGAVAYRDRGDNLWIDARAGKSRSLFCAHLDTVARSEGEHDIYISDAGLIHTGGTAVLGADDGAGIYVLARMLAHGVPGMYLFTQREECGGLGMADALRYPRRFDDLDRAIAFDRRGKGEICGAQSRGILASREFVQALADGLGLGHTWGVGTYTDNSELADLIPEIVNVSVGYEDNHGPSETLDWPYLQALADAACLVAWEDLPVLGHPESRADTWLDLRPGDWTPLDADDAVRDTLWDICDTLGLEPTSWEAQEVEYALQALVKQVAV